MANKVTLEALLERKLTKEVKTKGTYTSKILGADIEFNKKTLQEVTEIMDKYPGRTNAEGLKGNCMMILKHCPIFQEKELQEAYGVGEPWEVVSKVFDENNKEIRELVETILGLYGLIEEEVDVEAVKN